MGLAPVQFRAPEPDVLYPTDHAVFDLDQVAHAERPVEHDVHAREEVRQGVLRGECDHKACDAEAREEQGDVVPEGLNGEHDSCEDDDHRPHLLQRRDQTIVDVHLRPFGQLLAVIGEHVPEDPVSDPGQEQDD